MSGARHLLIGLDGAGLDIVRGFGAAALPNLHACMARGAFAALRSVQPPATLPNWSTLLTGDNPGKHGVFDFTTRTGYRVHFTAGSVRETPTIAARLDRAGLRCACLFFPGTFPPERLEHGVFVSGWDSPVAFEADRSFVWPPRLYDEIVQRFGAQRFDDVDEFDAESDGFHARLPDALCTRVARRAELGAWLLERQDYDVFALYFGESDTGAHHLWSLHDPGSPRRPAEVSPEAGAGLERVYRALDSAVGRLIAAAGGDRVDVTIVSDHGSGGASDRVLYLNRALAEAGFLRFRKRRALSLGIARAKDIALTRLPPRVRERLFRGFGAVLPGLVESRARFAAIDMPGTRVFSDELNYFPALHFNLREREPAGPLEPADRAAMLRELERWASAFRDPCSGERVIERLIPREALFHGPFVERAPDLIVELALPDGYSYNLMPSAGAPAGTGAFRRLTASEFLGRKGRSLPGSHRPRGLFVACGPTVAARGEVDAAMADVTATILARLQRSHLHECDGRVLSEVLVSPSVPSPDPLPASSLPRSGTGSGSGGSPNTSKVEERLRRLGYIE